MGRVRKPIVQVEIGPAQADNCHGMHDKDVVVLHETVSPNYPGYADLIQTSNYLDAKDYGIHSVIDGDGNSAWASGKEKCIFYHTDSSGSFGNGGINSRGIGIELISRIMLDYRTNILRFNAWRQKQKQIHKTARWLAWLNKEFGIPLVYSEGRTPGVTTHWQITHTFGVSGGHVDCWPRHKGGYFPVLEIINRAKFYRKYGW